MDIGCPSPPHGHRYFTACNTLPTLVLRGYSPCNASNVNNFSSVAPLKKKGANPSHPIAVPPGTGKRMPQAAPNRAQDPWSFYETCCEVHPQHLAVSDRSVTTLKSFATTHLGAAKVKINLLKTDYKNTYVTNVINFKQNLDAERLRTFIPNLPDCPNMVPSGDMKTLPWILIAMALCTGCKRSEQGRYQIINGTFNNRFTHENEALFIKIDTHTGRTWKLRTGPVMSLNVPSGTGAEAWQPLAGDWDKEVDHVIEQHKSK